MSRVEDLLRDALLDGAAALDESDDLFARVQLSGEEDRRLRRQRRRRFAVVACLAGTVAAVVFATTERSRGEWVMDWWVLETIWFAGMVLLALWLGPFIRRFGKSYAADVFRANPRTGKSFIVLMDVAYYLIFSAYILFAVKFQPDSGWSHTVNAEQLQGTATRFGGILLIVGVLHGLNVLLLPMIGRVLTLNRRLDQETPPPAPPARTGRAGRVTRASGDGDTSAADTGGGLVARVARRRPRGGHARSGRARGGRGRGRRPAPR